MYKKGQPLKIELNKQGIPQFVLYDEVCTINYTLNDYVNPALSEWYEKHHPEFCKDSGYNDANVIGGSGTTDKRGDE